MKNAHLIANGITKASARTNRVLYKIDLESEIFNADNILKLASWVNFLKTHPNLNCINVLLSFGTVVFQDKAACILIDVLLYDLIKSRRNVNVSIEMHIEWTHIFNSCFWGTALYKSISNQDHAEINRDIFLMEFEKDFVIEKDPQIHYRRLIRRSQFANSNFSSKVYTELGIVLKQSYGACEWVNNVSEVLAELVCNVDSHSDDDCLIDVSINNVCDSNINDDKSIPTEDNICGINAVIYNIGQKKIYEKVRSNVLEKLYSEDDTLYQKVYQAYENHKTQFSDKYTESHFFTLTAFQNHVTTRRLYSGMFGTGLPTLIENITNSSRTDFSYVLSGNMALAFDSNYLKCSPTNGFYGFNVKCDYITTPPDEAVLGYCPLDFPGTLYNLFFVKEVEI